MLPMKLYKIDKGVRLPPPTVNRKPSKPSPAALTMLALEPSESFIVRDPLAAVAAGKSMRDFNSRERERGTKRHFVARKAGDGIRIWRTK